jgi:hypothetical protein
MEVKLDEMRKETEGYLATGQQLLTTAQQALDNATTHFDVCSIYSAHAFISFSAEDPDCVSRFLKFMLTCDVGYAKLTVASSFYVQLVI